MLLLDMTQCKVVKGKRLGLAICLHRRQSVVRGPVNIRSHLNFAQALVEKFTTQRFYSLGLGL